MNSNFNVGALIVRGSLRWDDTTQHLETQWLCGGFVVIEGGNFFMSVQNVSHNAYIYLKDNSATHNSTLGNRVFGAVNYGAQTPVVGMSGRRLRRTWSLLSIPVTKGSNNISMTHDPIAMGWRVGDRILIASKSDHVSESFRIVSMNSADNRINLDKTTIQSYSAEFLWTGSDSHATMAAEVINLSRNVVITGDDFSTIPCDPSLPLIGTPLTNPAFHLTNPSGCSCLPLIKKTHCTVGLHTGMFGPGLMNMDYIRVEKCGQRGIKGRYCMHMHFLGLSPDSTLKGNAVENSHQRGIVVHETNAATIEENVMSDVRGAGIYVQDGNELWNRFKYNVVICPWNQDKSSGCTVPGTDNPTADSNLDQSAFYAITPSNDLIGNRFSGSISGIFYELDAYEFGKENAYTHVKSIYSDFGHIEGNVNHDMVRFGIWIKLAYPKACARDINNGFLIGSCGPYTPSGGDNGRSAVLRMNLDYSNFFSGGFRFGDLQFRSHMSIANVNAKYWRETKAFRSGCWSHVLDSYYSDGIFFVPDGSAFIIENTTLTGNIQLNVKSISSSGFLFAQEIVLVNVRWHSTSNVFVVFNENANFGGIYTLPPDEGSQQQRGGEARFFPSGYVSLVAPKWTYLLQTGACHLAADIADAFSAPVRGAAEVSSLYGSGIFCNRALRGLRIFPRQTQTRPLRLEIIVHSSVIASFTLPYWTSNPSVINPIANGHPGQQGYAFPVLSGTDFEYRISMASGSPDIPSDWIIEFSDPVFGNRWKQPDEIVLTVSGRCNKRIVTSQHDRMWAYAGSADFLTDDRAWGRGACSDYPDIPAVSCDELAPLTLNICQNQCAQSCTNGYCECGTSECACEPGFGGPDCTVSIMSQAYCGPHGQSIAKYLGSDLPVTQSACVCEPGWTGRACDTYQANAEAPNHHSDSSSNGVNMDVILISSLAVVLLSTFVFVFCLRRVITKIVRDSEQRFLFNRDLELSVSSQRLLSVSEGVTVDGDALAKLSD